MPQGRQRESNDVSTLIFTDCLNFKDTEVNYYRKIHRTLFLTSQICVGLNSYSVVVTILHHLVHIFGLSLFIQNLKVYLKSTLKTKFQMQNFSRTNYVRFPVLPWIFRFSGFSLNRHLSTFKMMPYDDPICPSCFPDVRVRFFDQNPVFQKLHFWSLHDWRNFLVKNFYRAKIVRDPVFP